MFKGITFGYYGRNGYFSSEAARREVDRIAELNIPWVCLVVTIMQDAYYSTRMYRDFQMTPGDEELVEIINYLHSKGIKVMMRPMIECWDGTQRMQVVTPQGVVFDDRPFRYRDEWFKNYTACTSHYLRIATKTGCEAYGTGWSGDMESKTWEGTPASTVNFSGNFMGQDEGITIVCTIVPMN